MIWLVYALIVFGGLGFIWVLVHFGSRVVGLMTVAGLAVLAAGIVGMALESTNHSACDSPLGPVAQLSSGPNPSTLASNCNFYNGVYYGGIALAVIGAALVVGGIVQRVRGATPRQQVR